MMMMMSRCKEEGRGRGAKSIYFMLFGCICLCGDGTLWLKGKCEIIDGLLKYYQ